MQTAVELVLQVILFLAIGWVVLFGGIGALISYRRGGWWLSGALWGVALGPIGWGIVFYRTRVSAGRSDSRRPGTDRSDDRPTDPRSDLDLP